MKTYIKILAAISFVALTSGVFAADDQDSKMPKADALYNEIMMTLPPEMKAKIDSSKMSTDMNKTGQVKVDSAKNRQELQEKTADQKARHIEELPDELRKQVEKAMQEMEKRQMERKLEFKEMKRGQ
jgi:hypothetical protein